MYLASAWEEDNSFSGFFSGVGPRFLRRACGVGAFAGGPNPAFPAREATGRVSPTGDPQPTLRVSLDESVVRHSDIVEKSLVSVYLIYRFGSRFWQVHIIFIIIYIQMYSFLRRDESKIVKFEKE